MRFFILLQIISVTLAASCVFAGQSLIFDHLTVRDGLSQSSVTCMLQDEKGFMWFGTQDGLNRYDGYTFRIYKNNPSDASSLAENFIFSLYESEAGILYVETQNGTLHRYFPATETFQVVNRDSVNLRGARMSTVGALLIEPDGVIWKGGLSKGTGLQRTDPLSGETTIFRHDPENPSSLSDDRVYSVFRDRHTDLWIGTYNGLDRLDEENDRFIHYRKDPSDPTSLPDNWVWPVFEDSRGNLWIGTVRAGLCLFDRKSGRFTNYRNNPDDPASLSNNFIFSIGEDRGSLIWVGTNLGGINYFRPYSNAFEHYKNDPRHPNSLSNNLVASMLVDRRGICWIGTTEGGLNRFDYARKKFTRIYHDPYNRNSPASNSIQSMLEDRSGILWFGSYNSGLDAYDPATGTYTHYTSDPSDPEALSDDRIYALVEDPSGDIWIGTYEGGLNRLNRKTGKFTSYRHDDQDTTTISSDRTWSLAEDNSGRLWIGTFGGGVNVLQRSSSNFRHYRNNPGDSTSIPDDNIIRIFKDSRGRMWIGSAKGLSRYLQKSDNFLTYDEQDGLANNFIYGIVEDDNGNLWLSTNNGLSKFNPESETFRNYYAKDGLQGNEFNQNAYAKDPVTGDIMFGGPNGFNIFNPDSLKDNTYPPPVVFTDFLRYNTDDEEGRPVIEKGISERDRIRLSYKDNIITLGFAALNFYNSNENLYRYKLEGFNENWIQLGNTHTVTFTNLDPGTYDLRVIGSNNDHVWNEKGAALGIYLSPPWWKTWIAYLIYTIIIFSVLFVIRKAELNRREQKAQIRESALRIKATEAEKHALEVENERKSRELEEARRLQLSMLPKELPQVPGLEIAAYMRTATEVGGDYYDFMVHDDHILNVAFGDATGHGLQAGTMVTLMKGLFTSDASRLGLQEFLNHCSAIIKEIDLGRILMSFSYLKIENRNLRITCAGMPPLYYFHKETGEVEEIFIPGIPLGAMRNVEYTLMEKELKSGDTILLLSDGLPEQMNGKEKMFDYPRVQELFGKLISQTPDEIIRRLVEACDKWRDDIPQADDITCIVIKVK